MIGAGNESNGLYHFPLLSRVCLVSDPPSPHPSQLGHPSLSKLQKLVTSLSKLSSLPCECCQLGKHVVCFPIESIIVLCLLLIWFTNVWGPSHTMSTLGSRYFVVTFIDDYSCCMLIILIPSP